MQKKKTLNIKTKGECYTIDSSGYITGYDYVSCSKNLVIPTYVEGKRVIGIKENTFRNKGITSVKFSEGIKEIKEGSFADNPIVQNELIIPASVTKIGEEAFYSESKNINKVKILSSARLETSSFAGGDIKEADLSNTIEVGEAAFENTNITKIKLSSTVEKIEERAFYNNKLDMEELVIPESLREAGAYIFGSNSKNIKTVIWESEIAVPNAAFWGSSIENIKIIKSEGLEDLAFYQTSYKTVDLGNNIKRIGLYSLGFNHMDSSPTIVIPSTIESINRLAFRHMRNARLIIKKPAGTIAHAPWGAEASTTVEYQG